MTTGEGSGTLETTLAAAAVKQGVNLAEISQSIANEKKEEFLARYEEIRKVVDASKRCGVPLRTIYEWLHADEAFARRYEGIKWGTAEDLIEVAEERGKDKSDLLLMFTIKGKRPEYRDKSLIENLDMRIYNLRGEAFHARLLELSQGPLEGEDGDGSA